jgi:hypothetical protein
MNVEPRKRFQENQIWVKGHQDLVVNQQFKAAVEAALVQMLVDSPQATNSEAAAAGFYRMEGARDFARVLLNLAEKPSIPSVNRTPNLNHNP